MQIPPKTIRDKIMIIYFLICYMMVSFPGLYIANRIRPYILGIPFLLFWCIFWAVVMPFAGMVYLYIVEEIRNKKEK